MIEEVEDDKNTNEDEASLNVRKTQKVNPSTELIHSSIDTSSGNEITTHDTATPFAPTTKSTPQTFTTCSSSDSNTNTSKEMFEATIVESF